MVKILAEERRERILQMLKTKNTVTVNDLAKHFDLSKGSIRRDLKILEKRGLVVKTYGGAMLPKGTINDPPFVLQKKEMVEEKSRIGRKAAEMVDAGDTLFIDTGTTALQVARHINAKKVTVLTNNLKVVPILEKVDDIEIIITGGCYRKSTASLLGPIAERTLKESRVNKAFLGTTAIDVEKGMMAGSLEEAQLKKIVIDSAFEIILIADSSKFGKQAFSFIAPNTIVDTILTDDNLEEKYYKKIEDKGINIVKC